jgi:acyl carrier protein
MLRQILADIAPDADLDRLAPDDDIRSTLDLDSVDFLNFVVAIHDATGIDVPEHDYPHLATLAACERYLRDVS